MKAEWRCPWQAVECHGWKASIGLSAFHACKTRVEHWPHVALCPPVGRDIPHMKTRSGTIISEGVEYNSYPPPSSVTKAMERIWAKKFIENGSMRFGSLKYYQTWEIKTLGDKNDGRGMFHMEGDPYEIESSNPVYVWCASLPDITPERVRVLAKEGNYDCRVRICQPQCLIHRVRDALITLRSDLMLQCSDVIYDRGLEVDKVMLNDQKFHFNVFQKDVNFEEDMEYRLSVVDCSIKPIQDAYIDIKVGNCSDIITIEDLP